MSAGSQLVCAACQLPLAPGDLFCEQCGTRLGDPLPDAGCQACGAPAAEIGEDGYCGVCGLRRREAPERTEIDLILAAAVSDQGRVHRRNEDAVHIERAGERDCVLVVCDGISSASAGDVAARSAAAAAGEHLARSLATPSDDPGAAARTAVQAAQDAVGQVAWTTRADRAVPSCTLVCATVRAGEITISWAGDSRAYWIDPERPRQLTVDHSWAEEQVASGLITAEQAAGDPRFHSITRWIGADAPPDPPPVVQFRPDRPGLLLLCSDGLWNYAPTAAELGALIAELPSGAAPAAVVRALTETALVRGGRDNITVAVANVDPS